MTAYQPLNTIPERARLRVDDYLLLDEAGAFRDYARTELLDGEIWFVNAQHRPHSLLKMRLYDALRDALRDARSPLCAIVEGSVSLPPYDVPEPDIAVTSEPEGEGPIPGHSVALVVEVSDSTLTNDLEVKAALYARSGIPEYWVADVQGRKIHRHCRPAGDNYAAVDTIAFGEPIDLGEITINTSAF